MVQGRDEVKEAFRLSRSSGEDEQQELAGMSLHTRADLARANELERVLAEKQAAMDELEASRTLLRSFHANSPHHAYIKRACGEYVSYNHAFAAFYGIDQELWVGKTASKVLPQAVSDIFINVERQVMESGQAIESYLTIVLPDRGEYLLRSIKFAVEGVRGERLLGGMDIDVTEEFRQREHLKAANRNLQQLARTDALTGLYSRGTFEDRMGREYALTERKNRSLALLVLDIDDFKKRNDSYGHAAGDDALRIVGRVLRGLVRAGEVAARIGGEEFGVMLPEASLLEASSLAKRIQAALADELCPSGPITVSIGVAAKGQATATWQDLLAQADAAMYEAKRAGKNCVAKILSGSYVLLAPCHVDAEVVEKRRFTPTRTSAQCRGMGSFTETAIPESRLKMNYRKATTPDDSAELR